MACVLRTRFCYSLPGISARQVPGVFSIRSLSVTQLNSEEQFIASLTLITSTPTPTATPPPSFTNGDPSPKDNWMGEVEGRGDAGHAQVVLGSVKSVLANHNIGRNTVEMLPLALSSSLPVPQGPGPVHESCSD